MESGSSGATTIPRLPDSRTKPCIFNSSSAWITGWRETLSFSASSSWVTFWPDSRSPSQIAARMAS